MTATFTDTESRLQEVLDLMNGFDQQTAHTSIENIVDVLRAWWTEYGESRELMEATCQKLSLDRATMQIYLRCPQLIPVMEPLRKGEPVRKLKITMSEEGRRWWVALLIVRALLKCDGLVLHTRLLQWLGHKANGQQIRDSLALLNESEVVHTFKVPGNDPFRPITWHRLTQGP